MTEIDFHFNMPDKLNHACRLLRKAVASRGACVVVVAEPDTLDAFDSALWTFSPTEFIAHCRSHADAGLVARSPVVLADSADAPVPHRQVLVNLGASLPEGFERFERLIELVGADESERAQARRRWRHYADRGYVIERHDFAAGAQG